MPHNAVQLQSWQLESAHVESNLDILNVQISSMSNGGLHNRLKGSLRVVLM